jgi:hypothetical protein
MYVRMCVCVCVCDQILHWPIVAVGLLVLVVIVQILPKVFILRE